MFLEFYQNLPSFVSPTLFSIGGFELRWYSLGYVFTIIIGGELVKWRIRHKENTFSFTANDVYDMYFYTIIGVILGGRIGYLLFYDINFLQNYPLQAFLPFRIDDNGWTFTGISGMSYHGGLIGFSLAFYFFVRSKKLPFWKVHDFVVPGLALGYTFGRLGNFMNGELFGRVTDVFWGMYFIDPATQLRFEELRHPSQLYEAFIEGIVIFAILWSIRNAKFSSGWISGIYLIAYGTGRFIVEFFREPDALFRDPGEELGTVIGFLTMGQILCILMGVAGVVILYTSKKLSEESSAS